MRIGMFVTATFYGEQPETHAAVPASAILHLHDRESVYMPLGDGHFKRVEVAPGNMLPNKQQEIVSGIKPGDQVVSNALDLQNTVEQSVRPINDPPRRRFRSGQSPPGFRPRARALLHGDHLLPQPADRSLSDVADDYVEIVAQMAGSSAEQMSSKSLSRWKPS